MKTMALKMKGIAKTAAVLIFLLINIGCVYLVFLKGNHHIYQENGHMENLQAVLLVISCIIFLMHLPFVEKHQSVVLLSCALLCYSFLLRELDVDDFEIPYFFIVIWSGIGRDIILSAACIVIAIYGGFNFKYYKGKIIFYLFSGLGILLLLCAAFLLVGSLFDHKIINVSYCKFYEEILELNSYYFILLGALVARSCLQGITIRSN